MHLVRSLEKEFFLYRARLLRSSQCLIGEIRAVGTSPRIYCSAEDGIPDERHVTKVMPVEPSSICRFTGLYLDGSERVLGKHKAAFDVNNLIFEGDVIFTKNSNGQCFWYMVIKPHGDGPRVLRLAYDFELEDCNFSEFDCYKVHSESNIGYVQTKAHREIVYNIYTKEEVKRWKR